jgi:hypothetical protein
MEASIIYLLIPAIGPEQERGIMTEDKDKSISEYRKKCICEPCPTYNECMRAGDELLFCVVGKAPACTFEKKGCICPTCPVWKSLNLKKAYYCIRGAEGEQK